MLTLGSFWVGLMAFAFVLVCLFMMLVILIQKPKGGGLSGAFGGAGGAVQTAFGSKVGDLLTWVTVVCFGLFLLLAMGLTWKIYGEQQASAKGPAAVKAPVNQPSTPSTPTTPAPLPPENPH